MFETFAAEAIKNELMEFVSGLKQAPKYAMNNSRTAVLTVEDLAEVFSEENLKKSFKMEMADDGSSGYVKGSLKAPTGDIFFGEEIKGVTANLQDLHVDVDASFSAGQKTMSGAANASARLEGSAGFDLSGIKNDTVLKAGKANILYSLALSGVRVEVDPSKMSDPESVKSISAAIKSASGSYSFYDGIDGAVYFEVNDAGKKYNGIIKMTVSGNAGVTINKDSINEILDIVFEIQNAKSGYGKMDQSAMLKKLEKYAKVNADVSVYDVAGTKLFTILSADSISKLYDEIESAGALK